VGVENGHEPHHAIVGHGTHAAADGDRRGEGAAQDRAGQRGNQVLPDSERGMYVSLLRSTPHGSSGLSI
jgi:hypothetical protein